jgi:hypothetical protein
MEFEMYNEESSYWMTQAYSCFDWNKVIVTEFNSISAKYQQLLTSSKNKVPSEKYNEYVMLHDKKAYCAFLLSNKNPNCFKPKIDSQDIEYYSTRKYYTVNFWVNEYKTYLTYVAKHKSNPENYRYGFVIPDKYLSWNPNLMTNVLESMVK